MCRPNYDKNCRLYSHHIPFDNSTGAASHQNTERDVQRQRVADVLARLVGEGASGFPGSGQQFNILAGTDKLGCLTNVNFDAAQLQSMLSAIIQTLYGVQNDGCREVTVDLHWSYRFYYTDASPPHRYIKVHVYGTVTTRYLDDQCQIQTKNPPDKFDIWTTFEITDGGLVNVGIDPPNGAIICPIIIQGGHKVLKFGSVDPTVCPRCKKPLPTPDITPQQ